MASKDPQTEVYVPCDKCPDSNGMSEEGVPLYDENDKEIGEASTYDELPDDLKNEFQCDKCEGRCEIEVDELEEECFW